MMMDDPSINCPKSLEELRKVQRLGVGSYGTVYLVQSLATGEYYALKELPKSRMLAGEFQRVMTEIELLKSVDHPLIVQTFGTFQDDNYIYILMEWAAGGELFHHIHTRQRLTNEQARFHAAQVILAVEYLHNRNIVYRDIKPENILVNSKGHIQLVDFGFAKRIPDGKTLTLCGTPEYLAPEVVEGKEYGFSADWWSVGVLVFEMLSGYSPFYNENVMDIFHNITKGKVEYPSFFDKNAVDMIKGLLTLNPQKRYSIAEIKRHPWFKGFNWDIRTMQSPMISEISAVNIAKTEEKVDCWGTESEVSDETGEDKEAEEDDFVCEEGEVLNLTKLITRATQEDLAQHPNYRTIVDDLVYTCWNFCEPQVFVRKLIERFFGPTKGSSKRNLVQFKKSQDFIQSRILFILRRWIPLLTAIELEAPWQNDEPTTISENDVDSENSEIEADFVEDIEQGLSRLSSKLTRTMHLSSVVDPIAKFVFTTSNDADAVPTLEDTLTNFIRYVESSGTYSSSLLDAVTSVKHKPLTVIFNTVSFGQSDYLSRISSVQSVLAPLSHARSLTSSGPQSRTQSLTSSSTSSLGLMSMPSSWVGVELTPEEIANQTTEMEKKLFCAIDVREMLSRPWDNKDSCPSTIDRTNHCFTDAPNLATLEISLVVPRVIPEFYWIVRSLAPNNSIHATIKARITHCNIQSQ